MRRPARVAPFALLFLPGIALAAGAPQNFQQLANEIVSLLGVATRDLIVLALVVYFYGVSSSLFKGGEKDRTKLRDQLLWGVAIIFFAVSIWGIVQLLQTTVFGSGDATNGTGGGTSGQTCMGLTCSSPFGGGQ